MAQNAISDDKNPEGAFPQTLLAWATFGSWGGSNKLAIRCLNKAWWFGHLKLAFSGPVVLLVTYLTIGTVFKVQSNVF